MQNYQRSILFICIGLCLLGSFCYLAPNSFKDSFQSILLRQYDYYHNIKEPGKILVIGGSSVAFGIDLDVMEDKTGRRCAELGIDYGSGLSFLLEASKSNLRSGDIVVIEFNGSTLDTFNPTMLLAGIGRRLEMYRFFLPRYWSQVTSAYPEYIKKCYYYSTNTFDHDDEYCGSAFDIRGCMTKLREGSASDLEFNTQQHPNTGRILTPENLSEDCFDFLNNYVVYCESLKVSVFFTHVPYLGEGWAWKGETWQSRDFERCDKILSSKLRAPVITSIKDAMYPREYFWDFPRHLNTKGAKIRSERLAEALKPYLESK